MEFLNAKMLKILRLHRSKLLVHPGSMVMSLAHVALKVMWMAFVLEPGVILMFTDHAPTRSLCCHLRPWMMSMVQSGLLLPRTFPGAMIIPQLEAVFMVGPIAWNIMEAHDLCFHWLGRAKKLLVLWCRWWQTDSWEGGTCVDRVFRATRSHGSLAPKKSHRDLH